MEDRYNYTHYIPEVLKVLSDNKDSKLSDIFKDIPENKEEIYREIVLRAVTAYMASQSDKYKSREKSSEYMWDWFNEPYSYIGGYYGKYIAVFKCTDSTSPFTEMERGQELEEGKLYLWLTGSPNTGGGGHMSTPVFNIDYLYAGNYSLGRFETVSRIEPSDYPEEIKKIIEKRES